MTFEEGTRPLGIRMGREVNLNVMSCEVNKVYLKRNMQFEMRDMKWDVPFARKTGIKSLIRVQARAEE